ncbi:MAG: hypothetical protein EB015_18440, partial [Methylocystaceae bacterium]|nr:hypothetical protein [Methylocystaceae bacterium]
MDVDYNVLKGKGLNIATPMYGGQCYGEYTRALSDVSQLCGKHSIRLQTSFLYNASLISAGRNILANNFLESDFDHLLFWDADVGVAYEQIFMLMNIQIECSNLDIVCGAYPKKVMDWERVDKAVKANIPPQKL